MNRTARIFKKGKWAEVVSDKKKEYKTGDWVYFDTHGSTGICKIGSINNDKCPKDLYVVDISFQEFNGNIQCNENTGGCERFDKIENIQRLATNEEIQKYMFQEVRKRYTLLTRYTCASNKVSCIIQGNFKFYNTPFDGVVIRDGNEGFVYYQGKWANIISREKEKEYSIGDWVYFEVMGSSGICKINHLNKNSRGVISYGAALAFQVIKGVTTFGENTKQFIDAEYVKRLATDEEVEKYLIAETYKKYPQGTKYKCAISNYGCVVKGYFKYSKELLNVTDGNGGSVYYKGKWAEIIKESTPDMRGYGKDSQNVSNLNFKHRELNVVMGTPMKSRDRVRDTHSGVVASWNLNVPEGKIAMAHDTKEVDKTFFYGKIIDCYTRENFDKLQDFFLRIGFNWGLTERVENATGRKLLHCEKNNRLYYSDYRASVFKPNFPLEELLKWIPNLQISAPNEVDEKLKFNINQNNKQNERKEECSFDIRSENSSISIGETRKGLCITRKSEPVSFISIP